MPKEDNKPSAEGQCEVVTQSAEVIASLIYPFIFLHLRSLEPGPPGHKFKVLKLDSSAGT
jgi:hypothetical protein